MCLGSDNLEIPLDNPPMRLGLPSIGISTSSCGHYIFPPGTQQYSILFSPILGERKKLIKNRRKFKPGSPLTNCGDDEGEKEVGVFYY